MADDVAGFSKGEGTSLVILCNHTTVILTRRNVNLQFGYLVRLLFKMFITFLNAFVGNRICQKNFLGGSKLWLV